MILAPSFLEELQAKGVTLSLAEQGRLSYTAPEDVMTPGMIDMIRAHKAELLALLQGQSPTPATPAAPAAPAPVVIAPGEDAVTEAVRFLDDLQAQGVTVRYYANGQCGVTVPPAWDDRQFNTIVTGILARDAMLRRLIPECPGAPEPYPPTRPDYHEPEPITTPDTEPLPVIDTTASESHARKSIHAGVLHNAGLSWLDAGKLHHAPAAPETFEALADVALIHGLRNVWITPGCSFSEYVFDHAPDFLTGKSDAHKTIVRTREYAGQAYPTVVSVNRLAGAWEERRIIYIYLPQFDSRWADDKANGWALADVEKPNTLLAALTYLYEALGVDIGAPGYTGVELIKQVNNSLTRAPFVRQADLTILPDLREVDLHACRALTDEECAGRFLHVYDRNSMYLAAATGAEIGEGTPEHIEAGYTSVAWDKHLTGVWHITVTGAPGAVIDARLWEIVKPFVLPFLDKKQQWAYTPDVDTLLALGYTVELHDAWVWVKTHRTLQPWGKLLWDTRQALRTDRTRFPNEQGAETARQMIKRIATQGLFWLDLQSDRDKVPTPQWHRFDMTNLIIALARHRMVLKLLQCARAGYYPVFVYTDGIGFISNEPTPALAVPGLMLVTDTTGAVHDRSTELGGFKCEHTFTVDAELISWFTGKLAPYQVKQLLNARAKGE